MTAKELAESLNGREYGMEIDQLEATEARKSGLVVVYGYSDDCMELEGAITEEFGSYEGGKCYVTKDGLVGEPECDSKDCEYYRKYLRASGAKVIKAVWHDEGNPCWTFETEIPHETFNIYEDGELFCVGIVFRLEDA